MICTEDPQYQGAVGRPVLQALLQDAGFTLTAADTSDPDWPHLSFRIDHKARQIAALTAQIAALTTSHQTLEQSLADQQTAATLQDQDHAQTVTALHDQLQAARDAQERLAVELATAKAAARQLELALTEAEGGNAKADQDSAILRNALDTAQSERFAAARRIDILEQRLAEEHRAKADLVATADRAARSSIAQSDLTAERDKSASLTRQVQELTAELATSGAQAAGYQQRITALEAAIASVKSAPDPQASATQTIADQAQRIKDLEFRQTLARDELRRSEGQLDLIKDLLLRGERL